MKKISFQTPISFILLIALVLTLSGPAATIPTLMQNKRPQQ